jgi:hypothetical protein
MKTDLELERAGQAVIQGDCGAARRILAGIVKEQPHRESHVHSTT